MFAKVFCQMSIILETPYWTRMLSEEEVIPIFGGREYDNRILLYKYFFKQAKERIESYRQVLEIPFIKTEVDDSNGVYLGFIENAPTLCIWDCKAWGA